MLLRSLFTDAIRLESEINTREICSYSILNLPGRDTKIFPDNMSPLLLI